MAYGIFQKLSEHETVWVGSAKERGETEQRLESLAQTYQKEFFGIDLDSGEIIDSQGAAHPSESH
ncbi:MAG TPA: hypothetical protein VG204_18575 [Terriglobia bacterium]|nr:hypothetical protein [Terriglobia bacterium]